MGMLQKYGAGPDQIDGMTTAKLRDAFMVEAMFLPGQINFAYTHFDRMIVGGAVPTDTPLSFGDGADVGTPFFFDAREMGIANLGGAGWIEVDGTRHALGNRDVLYIGRGTKSVTMGADAADTPPHFYMNSVPAGADIPTPATPSGVPSEPSPGSIGPCTGAGSSTAASVTPCTTSGGGGGSSSSTASDNSVNSIRRFASRPASVSLLSTGRLSP